MSSLRAPLASAARSHRALWTLLLLLGCARPAPLEVAVSGCRERWIDGRCAIDRGAALTFVAEVDGALEIEHDGVAISSTVTRLQGGLRARLGAPGPGRLIVAEAIGRRRRFRLELVEHTEPEAVARADRLRRGGALVEAEAALAALDPGSTDAIRMRARIALQAGRHEEAVATFRRAIDRVHAEGRLVAEADDRAALAYVLSDRLLRYPEALTELDRLEALAPLHPPAAGWAAYFRSNLLREVGDLRSALRHNTHALELAERLGVDTLGNAVADRRVELLVRLGRLPEAGRASREVLARAASAPACARAIALHNAGWAGLIAGGGAGFAPLADLGEAVGLFERECPQRDHLHTARLNLADAMLDAGQIEAARSVSSSVPTATAAPRLALRALLVAGRLASAEGENHAAVRAFSRAEEGARRAGRPELEHEAATHLGAAFDALGAPAQAEAAYARAEAVLDGHHALVPFGHERSAFLGRHAESTRAYVRSLLARDRARDAVQVVLRSRSRALSLERWTDRLARGGAELAAWYAAVAEYRATRAHIDDEAAADWKRSAEALGVAVASRAQALASARAKLEAALAGITPPRSELSVDTIVPRAGDAALVYFERQRGDWLGFAVDRDGVRWRHIGAIPLDRVGQGRALLDPFSATLRGARAVRVFTDGALDAIDFHALPFGEAPLLALAPLSYPVGLAASATVARSLSALVVADPRGDLPGARAEAEVVAAALTRLGFAVTRLDGERASHRALLAALERVTLFHYAGHGEWVRRDAMASGLPLADGGWLDAGDVLSLARGPRLVVLSGCETARTSTDSTHAGASLAHAFVAAGADQVVAARVPVADELALDVVRLVFTASVSSGAPNLSASLRRAQLSLAGRWSAEEWGSFRVVSR